MSRSSGRASQGSIAELVILSATFILSSLCDAAATLVATSLGAVELNPVMSAALSHGTASFIVAKALLTSVSLSILVVVHSRAPRAARIVIMLCSLVFVSVSCTTLAACMALLS